VLHSCGFNPLSGTDCEDESATNHLNVSWAEEFRQGEFYISSPQSSMTSKYLRKYKKKKLHLRSSPAPCPERGSRWWIPAIPRD